ncbi:uncharacterized protein LY89DRAFT_687078 [Mollisia scopiformis]|uniref:Uncharacterized protein n=1 Tax=Mollisia scopiformis TaxID=149040 RepID=A0A194X0F4_MOLSC|nr:uncharacterized protein LY89DRAFT_687078 [Mollisia scopiformis]KUJ13681.1 hypothetical protein LY89DRAFT_687078 [Mollisia scopiformis]
MLKPPKKTLFSALLFPEVRNAQRGLSFSVDTAPGRKVLSHILGLFAFEKLVRVSSRWKTSQTSWCDTDKPCIS